MKTLFLVITIFISIGLVAYGLSGINNQEPGTKLIQENIYRQLSVISEFTRTYHVRSELACGPMGDLMTAAIYQVPGVQSVYPIPYEFTVGISPVYKWDEVEQGILENISKLIYNYEVLTEPAEDGGLTEPPKTDISFLSNLLMKKDESGFNIMFYNDLKETAIYRLAWIDHNYKNLDGSPHIGPVELAVGEVGSGESSEINNGYPPGLWSVTWTDCRGTKKWKVKRELTIGPKITKIFSTPHEDTLLKGELL